MASKTVVFKPPVITYYHITQFGELQGCVKEPFFTYHTLSIWLGTQFLQYLVHDWAPKTHTQKKTLEDVLFIYAKHIHLVG